MRYLLYTTVKNIVLSFSGKFSENSHAAVNVLMKLGKELRLENSCIEKRRSFLTALCSLNELMKLVNIAGFNKRIGLPY